MLRTEIARIGSISRVVFGCAAVGGRVSQRASLRAMAEAFDAGITTFDVARSYGYGDAELILGTFLRGRRSNAEIVTKAGILAPRSSLLRRTAKSAARQIFARIPRARLFARPVLGRQHAAGHFAPDELEASLVASLRALRTDYVDTLLLHACTAEVAAQSDVLETLQDFVRRGMAKRIGVASSAEAAAAWCGHGADCTAEVGANEVAELRGIVASDAMWLANQPLGGGSLLNRVQTACKAEGMDQALALEFLLHRPFERGAHGVVLSMLSQGHANAAIRAFTQPRLTSSERQALQGALTNE